MKVKPKRTDKVLMGVFIGAVVVAVLIVAVVVFDAGGILGAQVRGPRNGQPAVIYPGPDACRPTGTLPEVPGLTPEAMRCRVEYAKCLAGKACEYDTCQRNALAQHAECVRGVNRIYPAGDPRAKPYLNACAQVLARDIQQCNADQCVVSQNERGEDAACGDDLIRCIDALPDPENPNKPPPQKPSVPPAPKVTP